MRRIKNIALYKKIIGLVIGFVFLLCISNIFIIKVYVYNKMLKELTERGLSIGRNLSENCVEYILTDNIIELQKIVSRTKKIEKDIIYIFIQDINKKPIVHTFENYFPVGLDKVNYLTSDKKQNIQILKTEYGYIRDIALPILNGRIGTVRLGISEKYIQETISSLIIRIIIIMFIISFALIVLIYIFTMKILSPLREITSAIKSVGEGEFNQKINIKSSDEIGILSNAFNEMVEKLKKANIELKNAQSKLIQVAKMATISQFAAGIAHEINNPLSGVLNCIRTLLSDHEIKGERRGYLELSLKGLLRIEDIIRKVLYPSTDYGINIELVNISKVLKETLEQLKHQATNKKISISLNLAPHLPDILADKNQLQQVFTNIIINAFDAMPKGGTLTIQTFIEDKNIKIKFADTGYGIKKENLDKVFEPFWTTKEVGEGTGLGLFIAYNIIQQYKGTIDIESIEGEGTKVIITLPIEWRESNVK
jgi:two-component system NtrC family sensor kinase